MKGFKGKSSDCFATAMCYRACSFALFVARVLSRDASIKKLGNLKDSKVASSRASSKSMKMRACQGVCVASSNGDFQLRK
jgi:hypothetical protein